MVYHPGDHFNEYSAGALSVWQIKTNHLKIEDLRVPCYSDQTTWQTTKIVHLITDADNTSHLICANGIDNII